MMPHRDADGAEGAEGQVRVSISVGQGRTRTHARLVTGRGETPATALVEALRSISAAEEAWWSPHRWRFDRRLAKEWVSAQAVAIDVDYHDDSHVHALMPADVRARLLACAAEQSLPGAIFHLTPRGLRVIYPLVAPCSEENAYKAAAAGARLLVALTIGALGLPGLEVDGKASDLARFMYAPNALVNGDARRAEIVLLRDRAWSVAELAAVAATTSTPPALLRAPPATPPHDPVTGEVFESTEAVMKRLRAWLQRADVAVSGQRGHDKTIRVASKIAAHAELSRGQMMELLEEWNQGCDPRWSPSELDHKLDDAIREGKGTRLPDRDPPMRAIAGGKPAGTPPTPGAAIVVDQHWQAALLTWTKDKNGENRVARTLDNIALILTHDPVWKGVLAFDKRTEKLVFVKEPPVPLRGRPLPAAIGDDDITSIARWLDRTDPYRIVVGPKSDILWGGVENVCRANPVDRVREYLVGLRWDGVERLAHMPHVYLGAEPTPTNAEICTRWMLSAVARAMVPGCKADHVLVLVGKQGAGKSTFFEILGGGWYASGMPDVGGKDAMEWLRGPWIAEIEELNAFSRANATSIKSFITRASDRFRPAYGRIPVDAPRRLVFGGTTNEAEFLRDSTGGRRFWPVEVATDGPMDTASLRRDRDQLWAEAFSRFQAGEQWHVTSEEAIEELQEKQEQASAADPWAEPITEYVEGQDEIAMQDILHVVLRLDTDKRDPRYSARVAAILNRLGFKKRQVRSGAKRVWKYVRK